MATPADFVSLELTNETETTASWFAEKRILYEYPLHDQWVFGDYGPQQVRTIQRGVIGELAVFQYLHEALSERYGGQEPHIRFDSVRGRLSLNITLGSFDPGYDLTVVQRTVDVKAYATRDVTLDEIPRFNLLVNQREVANRQPAELYIQVFFTADRQVILAGYCEGLPPLNSSFPSPAHACRVPDLLPMTNLRRMVLGNT